MQMLIYPYGQDCEPIIRHSGLLDSNYKIAALASPGGWGQAGKYVTIRNSGVSLSVHESLKKVTEKFDSLLIPSFKAEESIENLLVDQIVKLIPRLTHVFCVANLTDANQIKLRNACSQISPSCVFEYYPEYTQPSTYNLKTPAEKYPSISPLDVPIVIVAGLWENTDKFEVSLSLREQLISAGYRVTQIGSRVGCEMLGFHSFPGFMFRKDVDAADKVIYFNRWIIQIAKMEQPDLVLLTIPGAMQDLNEKFTRGFGLLHHQVFKAAVPDVLVMCTFFDYDPSEFLKEISKSCCYRFGAPVDLFHISNLFIDITTSEEFNRVVTNSIYRETVSEMLSKMSETSPIPMFDALDQKDNDRMFDMIINKLTPKDIIAVMKVF